MEDNTEVPKLIQDYLDELLKQNNMEEHSKVVDDFKKSKLRELRALQDLIFASCLREDKGIKDVIKSINVTRKAFNIKEIKSWELEDFNTTETGY